MKRYLVIVIALLGICSTHAEVKILSTEAWTPTITGFWSPESGLSYSNSVYGETYYNPYWQDMRKSSSIQFKTVTRHFDLKPDQKRPWKLSFTLSNLNAEQGRVYFSASRDFQRATQIYWGIHIGYKESGIDRTTTMWFKRSEGHYTDGSIIPGSDAYVEYSVDNAPWKINALFPYPSCSPNSAPTFFISTSEAIGTWIAWDNTHIELPIYMEELRFIQIFVGTQAKIQIGKPTVFGKEIKQEDVYVASEYMETENYAMVVRKLYNADNIYYEQQAANLAWAYASTNEIDKALEICEALIKFEGTSLNYAHSLRGLIREYKGQKEEALEDYMMVNDMTNYNRLQDKIKTEQAQEQKRQQQKQQQQKTSSKPTLTK